MAEEVRKVETVDDTPRDTVVVREGKTNTGLIVLGVIIVLLLIFFLWGNPFDNDAPQPQIDVDVPTPNVNVETPTDTTPETQTPAQ
jgi:hypothetical protein